MLDLMFAKLRLYDDISAAEERDLRAAAARTHTYRRGDTIVAADTELTHSTYIEQGLAHRFKDLLNGQRQSLELGLPGDFVDLHSLLMKRIDHDVAALTDCVTVSFPHERLLEVTTKHPHLTRVLWLTTIVDAAIHRQWILSLGARDALQRMTHLFCETMVRNRAVGLGDAQGYELPITQSELAEMLGMTSVHANRLLRHLREDGVLTFAQGHVRILDWDRLRQISDFDPAYLGMEKRPR